MREGAVAIPVFSLILFLHSFRHLLLLEVVAARAQTEDLILEEADLGLRMDRMEALMVAVPVERVPMEAAVAQEEVEQAEAEALTEEHFTVETERTMEVAAAEVIGVGAAAVLM